VSEQNPSPIDTAVLGGAKVLTFVPAKEPKRESLSPFKTGDRGSPAEVVRFIKAFGNDRRMIEHLIDPRR
jgi:hypothetical protein